jgi:hypothetical protein
MQFLNVLSRLKISAFVAFKICSTIQVLLAYMDYIMLVVSLFSACDHYYTLIYFFIYNYIKKCICFRVLFRRERDRGSNIWLAVASSPD